VRLFGRRNSPFSRKLGVSRTRTRDRTRRQSARLVHFFTRDGNQLAIAFEAESNLVAADVSNHNVDDLRLGGRENDNAGEFVAFAADY